jgi:Glycyl-tRNA synthetase beta subunit
MGPASWDNAVSAMPVDSALLADIGIAVANDGSPDGAARWLLTMGCNTLRKAGAAADNPWMAFDAFICDFEALADLWPAFQHSAKMQPLPAAHTLPGLARFICERLPAIWLGPWLGAVEVNARGERRVVPLMPVAPLTAVISIADRIDTLVSMFAVGLKPNGSKDPFALRRAAKEFVQLVAFPVTTPKEPT